MGMRFGIDVGGTFTDLILFDETSGSFRVAKVASHAEQPELSCIDALNSVLRPGEADQLQYFMHGNTVGLNALLERKGARIGLIATDGFRDVLEVRRGDRDDILDLFWSPPAALVPRFLRLGVRERILADGRVLDPLAREDVEAALATFRENEVESIAVALINSYVNPAHELAIERILREGGFTGTISLSHQVTGEYREFERTSTTSIDAYVGPKVSRYLRSLSDGLRAVGFSGESLVMRSGGGSLTFEEAASRPVDVLMSGPVGGAEGTARLSRRHGLGDVIAADVGGTSFDTCLIVGGYPQVKYQAVVQGHPIQAPWVDVRSIGAGGGSIAEVDVGGLLQVGPRSAGAWPGPACYGRGGKECTLTDACFVLGMLGHGQLASSLMLDRDAAMSVVQKLADSMQVTAHEAACGVVRLATARMTNAIREITLEQGIDPRTMPIFAYGGAGPMMATELARALDINEVIVPEHAGNFSAWGLLGSDVVTARSRTRILPLTDAGVQEINQTLIDLYEALRQPTASEETRRETRVDLRYRGQEYSLTLAPAARDGLLICSAAELSQLFTEQYHQAYGVRLNEAIEFVSARAVLRRILPSPTEQSPQRRTTASAKKQNQTFSGYSFAKRAWIDFAVYDRAEMHAGDVLCGPAIISELTTTTYVDADFQIEIMAGGLLRLRRDGGESSR